MTLPAIEAERWRFVDQKLAEMQTEVQRLWRRLAESQINGATGFSDALLPEDLEALTAASGSGTQVVWLLNIAGNPIGGTVDVTVRDGSGTSQGTFTAAYNISAASFKTAIDAATGITWTVSGGNWPYNEIEATAPTAQRYWTISLSGPDDLTEDAYTPYVSARSCNR